MRRSIRRIAALLSGALILQLVLVGSGYACARPMQMATGANAADMSAMAGKDMTNMPAAARPANAPPPDDAPCRLPWAPAGCQSMTPCAPIVVASPSVTVLLTPPAGASRLALVVVVPTARSIPPEPPPPKA